MVKVLHFTVHESLRLAADEFGPDDGIPVVLLHGGGQTRKAWGQAAAQIAVRGYRAIAVDLRGHGDSDWSSDGDYRLDACASDVRAIAAQLGRPVVTVGASLGGISATLACGEAPTVPILALVLVDITTRVDNLGTERVRTFMEQGHDGFSSVAEAADSVAAYLHHRERPKDLSGLRKNLRLRGDGRFYWHWDARFISPANHPDTSNLERRLDGAVREIKAPILLLHGSRSDVVTEREIKAFKAIAPDAETTSILGARHMVAGDANTAFSSAILDFIDRRVKGPQL